MKQLLDILLGPFGDIANQEKTALNGRVNLGRFRIATLLAWLIPGCGHFYQGRTLKAGIYFVGIMSLFVTGMALGDWQPVYASTTASGQLEDGTEQSLSISFAPQACMGVSIAPAIVQYLRYEKTEGPHFTVSSTLESDFDGVLKGYSTQPNENLDISIPVQGTIKFTPERTGVLTVKTRNGTSVSIPLDDAGLELGKPVFGSPRREIESRNLPVALEVEGVAVRDIYGSVSRPFIDWFQAPRDTRELDRMHAKLSQQFDVACVFTWIAGLLNLMAIWDAYDGPAYGYGDEEDSDDSGKESSE